VTSQRGEHTALTVTSRSVILGWAVLVVAAWIHAATMFVRIEDYWDAAGGVAVMIVGRYWTANMVDAAIRRGRELDRREKALAARQGEQG